MSAVGRVVRRCCLGCFGGARGGARKASSSSSSPPAGVAGAGARARAELRGAWGARVVACEAPPAGAGAGAGAGPKVTPRGSPVLSFVHGRLVMPSGGDAGGRIILVGDVHGCLGELRSLLTLARVGDGDVVMLVGDLVNKGPSSAGVVAFARERGMLAVRGNHDDVAIGYGRLCAEGRADEVPEEWRWTAELSEEDIAFMSELPFSIDIPEHNVVVVHAGLVPGVDMSAQRMEDMYLMRNVVREAAGPPSSSAPDGGSDGGGGGAWTGTSKASKGEAWASRWRGPRHVVFGHDALRKLQEYPFATGLDTGCVYGHALTACILPPLDDLESAPPLYESTELRGHLISVAAEREHCPVT